jgi:hypothetical protein
LAAVIVSTTGSPAAAEEPVPSGDMLAAIEDARERLQLTDEQLEQVRVVMQAAIQETRAILERYGVQPGEKIGLGKKIKIANKLRRVQKKTDKNLARFLDKDQMKELKAIRKEMRQAAKNRTN